MIVYALIYVNLDSFKKYIQTLILQNTNRIKFLEIYFS